MRRLFVLALVALGGVTSVGVASAEHGDVVRPLCADISTIDPGFSTVGNTTVAGADVTTVEPSCRGITYTLCVILDPEDPASEVVCVSRRGNGGGDVVGNPNILTLSTTISDNDPNICVYVETSRGGPTGTNQLIDRFPNADATPDCVSLTLDQPPGVIGHG